MIAIATCGTWTVINYSFPAEIHTTNIVVMFAIHPRKIGVMFTNLAIVGGCTLLLVSA